MTEKTNLKALGSTAVLGARYTASSTANRTVTVYRFTTTPTDSSEPLFRVEVLTAKEAAIEEIMAQPFYAPNAQGEPRRFAASARTQS